MHPTLFLYICRLKSQAQNGIKMKGKKPINNLPFLFHVSFFLFFFFNLSLTSYSYSSDTFIFTLFYLHTHPYYQNSQVVASSHSYYPVFGMEEEKKHLLGDIWCLKSNFIPLKLNPFQKQTLTTLYFFLFQNSPITYLRAIALP